VYLFRSWPEWKITVIRILKSYYDEHHQLPDKNVLLQEVKKDDSLKIFTKQIMAFYMYKTEELESGMNPETVFSLELSFNEVEVFNILGDFFKSELEVESFIVFDAEDTNLRDDLTRSPGQPGSPDVFYS